MLRGTVAFLVLVAFAVVGTELREALSRRGLRAPALEGVFFLAVGFALGGRGLGLFPEDVLANLRVVVLFGLGWIGLVFGIPIATRHGISSFDGKVRKRRPSSSSQGRNSSMTPAPAGRRAGASSAASPCDTPATSGPGRLGGGARAGYDDAPTQ